MNWTKIKNALQRLDITTIAEINIWNVFKKFVIRIAFINLQYSYLIRHSEP